jgi:DNA-binding transcriptional MerR regulator
MTTPLLTIGDFSRAVQLSAKALRFYHRAGVLAPAVVDEQNGYRLYAPEQIADAQIVRTLRALDLPVESIRVVMAESRIEARSELLAQHLRHLEQKLDETRTAVRSLRSMLEEPSTPIEITHRRIPETRVIAVRETIALPDLGRWFRRSVATLRDVAPRSQPSSIGPIGGLWSTELFAEEHGEATLFLPTGTGLDERIIADAVGLSILDLPAVELAVAVHDGPDETVPRVYAALGEHVARHELGTDAPVRET